MKHALRSRSKPAGFSSLNGILSRHLSDERTEGVMMVKRGERGYGEITGRRIGLNAPGFVAIQQPAISIFAVPAFTPDDGELAPDSIA